MILVGRLIGYCTNCKWVKFELFEYSARWLTWVDSYPAAIQLPARLIRIQRLIENHQHGGEESSEEGVQDDVEDQDLN